MKKPPNQLILRGRHYHEFRLSVEQYEFPESTEHWDANFLVLSIEAQNDDGN